ncbi:type II toxin-antitoxin system RelE/ParE family toxin [uncultured Paracoccus sp.]|uniref:type II toxin-antitoxin system RelE/ParE family toxin n=1 Tax=uncultured Paracoccus sp. TaxID=189685 RepID=UPI0025E3D2F0|nr:type II toxin-antitoxin system RelE/ParE family toxin [uncultured Paracoccus sp.]
MKERQVVFAPEAAEDLAGLYDWIANAASPAVAIAYLGRVEGFCRWLGIASERGHLRADIRPNLRIIGFERRLTVAFAVGDETVTILWVFAAGRDWEGVL